MKERWYYTRWPLAVTQIKPEPWQGLPYPTFRAARMALIEQLQDEATMYRTRAENKLKEVVLVAHFEEPS